MRFVFIYTKEEIPRITNSSVSRNVIFKGCNEMLLKNVRKRRYYKPLMDKIITTPIVSLSLLLVA